MEDKLKEKSIEIFNKKAFIYYVAILARLQCIIFIITCYNIIGNYYQLNKDIGSTFRLDFLLEAGLALEK